MAIISSLNKDLDQRKDLRTCTPAPASPAPSASAALAPLVQERTRGARNATDADLEAVLRLSEQSAREEQERRERETAEPNYDTEAVLPPMLQPAELEIKRFKDTNKLVPMDLSVEMFELTPPVDDFTPEEQSTCIAAYNQQPKKFGKIAEKLPGRTYQQCIMHYYLTKEEAKYKENFRKVAPKSRGRRKLPASGRASALLTENMYQDDTENAPITDSGRPRRAAAPIFGENGNDPETALAQQAVRRTAAGPKEANGEMTKPTRGRKVGTGTRTRRTKAQIAEDKLAQAQAINGLGISPQKTGRAGRLEKAVSYSRDAQNSKPDLLLAGEIPQVIENEGTTMQHPTLDYSPLPQPLLAPAVPTAPQIGSYWSVPEQQKFPELIAYFGRDFPAIAEFMKTKTTVMVSE